MIRVYKPAFTIFDLVEAIVGFTGLCLGFLNGSGLLAKGHFGLLGGIIGAALGGFVGWFAAEMPYRLIDWIMARKLANMSVEQLRTAVLDVASRNPPRIHDELLELKRRRQDIQRELPHVLDMLISKNWEQRNWGMIAMIEAYPDLAKTMKDYDPQESVEVCRQKTEALRKA